MDAHPLRITLEFGRIHAGTSPFASVTTSPSGRLSPGTGAALLNAAASLFRTRLAAIRDPAADGVAATTERSQLCIDGNEVACLFVAQGSIWTALAYLPASAVPPSPGWPGTLVTVAARSIPPADIVLARVTDLEPFRRTGKELEGLPERTPELLPLPSLARLSAIEELILAAVKESANEERAPREARNWIIELQARWAAAHQTQMRFGRQPAAGAARALMELLDQMKSLAATVSWWQEAGPDAVAESTRHTVFGSDVASLKAQRLWGATHTDPAIRVQWLGEWERWYRLRRRRAL